MIFVEYPGHLIALGLVAASAAIVFLAFRSSQLQTPQRGRYRWLLAAIHGTAVLALLAILWDPSTWRKREVSGRNAVLAVFDTSESMSIADDEQMSRLDKSIREFAKHFESRGAAGPEYRIYGLDTRAYHSGSMDLLRRWGSQSNLQEAFSLVADRAAADSPAGMILFTDGRADDRDPRRYLPLPNSDLPMVIVGVGARGARPDVAIKTLSAPATVWIDSVCEVAVVVATASVPPAAITLELVCDDKVVGTRLLRRDQFRPCDPGPAEALVEFTIPAEKLGTRVLTARAKPCAGEMNLANNSRSASMEVTQERSLRVLLYTQWANFDVGKIRRALTWDRGIRLDFGFDVIRYANLANRASQSAGHVRLSETQEGLCAYDVIILGPHDWSALTPAQCDGLYNFVTERGGGLVLLPGATIAALANGSDERGRAILPALFGQDDPRLWPPHREAIQPTFEAQVGRLFDPNAFANPQQSVSPFYGIPRAKPASTTLATAGVTPVILTHRVGRGRVCLLNASKLFMLYREDRQGGALGALVCGLVRYLGRTPAQGAGVELFVERVAEDPDRVVFDAYVVDKAFEPVVAANVLLTAGEQVVSMEPTSRGYYRATLDWGRGQSIVATAQAELNGSFLGERTLATTLPPVRDEMSCVDLDELFLKAVAERMRARYVHIDDLDDKAEDSFAPKHQVGFEEVVTSVWPRWTLFVVLCLLLSAEWFIRRAIGLV